MNSETARRLLIVDDAPAQLKVLCKMLTGEGFTATGFVSAHEALAALRTHPFELLLTDLTMPEMDGISLVRAAHTAAPDVVSIVMTGDATIDTAVRAMQAGALDYILKPFKMSAILPVLHRALEVRALRLNNRELEQKVHRHARELEEANRDLESFSYSVSHDLRGPLTVAQGFCELYVRDFGYSIPAKGLPLLKQALASTRRMGQLIEDLLALSRLGRGSVARQLVSLDDLVLRVTADLQAKEPDRGVDIRIGKLGRCEGDPSLLEQVLVNLLSNALKFTRGRHPGIIEVGCTTQQDGAVYFVRDNGAGFDMQYADRLFTVFQRLHSVTQFEGTGVGLSIAQRIVERHGGRIWAESEVGKGATFHFTIPGKPSDCNDEEVQQ